MLSVAIDGNSGDLAGPFDAGIASQGPSGDETLRISPRARVAAWLDALAFGVLGFLAGIVFWHFVGFWGFVSEVVLMGPIDPDRLMHAADSPAPRFENGRADPVASTRASRAGGCAMLVLDRATGRTHVAPCGELTPVLTPDSAPQREDLAIRAAPLSPVPPD
ncbi:MAG TPA: hypothetical protein VJ045_09985 [Hyphomicrobiaceae bacterium]|nr:hypothetical protein [Hyphomicrobiaceae bacterium]